MTSHNQTAIVASTYAPNLEPADFTRDPSHLDAPETPETEAEKWERDGRAEMYAMLELTDY